jgi:hypothetical protein
MTISGALVIMVAAVFLVQNEFYSWLLLRTEVQENARAMTELMASEIRSVPLGGVVLADSQRVVVRSPMVSALVCGIVLFGAGAYVHVPAGIGAIDPADVGSLGVLDSSTGAWTLYDTSWTSLNAVGGTPAVTCAGNGADTTGISSEFRRIDYLSVTGSLASVGKVLMIGRKTEFRIAASTLIPGLTALYRGNYGGTLSEFATGLASDASFQYRYGTTTHYSSVTGGNLALIDGIRIVARSTGRGESGGRTQYAFGWTVDVPLVNAR